MSVCLLGCPVVFLTTYIPSHDLLYGQRCYSRDGCRDRYRCGPTSLLIRSCPIYSPDDIFPGMTVMGQKWAGEGMGRAVWAVVGVELVVDQMPTLAPNLAAAVELFCGRV